MKSKIFIKLKELEDGSIDEKLITKGDMNTIINGLIDTLYVLCIDNDVDLNKVCKDLKECGKKVEME